MNDDAVFTFDLQETLYFESGQEVAEMKGISLDPEITIQEFDDYIAIRGVIELQGEYEKQAPLPDTTIDQEEDTSAKRYVERVMDTENDEATFMHRFPVEISVPSYRVTHLDDVYVRIDEFDYTLPDPYQLRFTSSISIHGIQDEKDTEEPLSEPDETLTDKELIEDTFASEFEFESRNPLKKDQNKEDLSEQADEVGKSQANEVEEENLSQPDQTEESPHSTAQVSGENEEAASQKDRPVPGNQADDSDSEQPADQSDSDSEDGEVELNDDETKEQEETVQDQSQTLADLFENTSPEKDGLSEDEASSEESITASQSHESPDSEMEREEILSHVEGSIEPESDDVKDVMYLANMFASEEESYANMTLYIVQANDTIDAIADKYDVRAERIMQHNQLVEDTVSQGQLLYIPVKKEDSH